MTLLGWVRQDWAANAGRPETQLLLAWFRLAQWADRHWGTAGLLVVKPYWLVTSLLLGFELPVTATVGPRLRMYHRNGIVVSAHATLGSDCQLRHAVTVGNKTDRAGREVGVARVGDHVDLGAGCAVIGDIEVGDHARVGALAVVTRSVPAWAIVAGNPGRVIRIDGPGADGPGADGPAADGPAADRPAADGHAGVPGGDGAAPEPRRPAHPRTTR